MPSPLTTADPRRAYASATRSEVAVLLIHGFTSIPGALFEWAAGLESAGYDVSVPLLEGHGTRWEDLAATRHPAWLRQVEKEYDRLRSTHRQVVVAGMSMGGALALHVAAVRHPAAVLLVNPAVHGLPPLARFARVLAPIMPTTAPVADDIARSGVSEGAYELTPTAGVASLRALQRHVRQELSGVIAPVTLFRSDVDHVVPAASVRALLAGLTPDARLRLRRVALHRSFHVATLDHDAPLILEASLRAIEEATDGGAA